MLLRKYFHIFGVFVIYLRIYKNNNLTNAPNSTKNTIIQLSGCFVIEAIFLVRKFFTGIKTKLFFLTLRI